MQTDLEQHGELGAELCARAKAAGAMLIWRAQVRSTRRIVIRKGRPEASSVSSSSGHGLQLVGAGGHTALGSRDDFDETAARALLDRLLEVTAAGSRLGLERQQLPTLKPEQARIVPEGSISPDDLDLADAGRRLVEIENEILGQVAGVNLQLGLRAVLESWRIRRSDGTDVLFSMPRCALTMRASNVGDSGRHAVTASTFAPGPGALWSEETLGQFLRRCRRAATLARELPDAPAYPAGSYPLVIDYALAKGLAHEAFGHAAEADGFRSSVLATDGRFRAGEKVGAEHVSIIDEPVPNDHAWQPISANGIRRDRACIVDHGRLLEGLSDPWSAEAGGVRITGAARAESYRAAPQPRMTNIRIEVDAPLPAPGDFEDYGPEEVRQLLVEAGVFSRHPKVVFLSGYSGGQVNTASGDFVFNCKAIYELGPQGYTFHKPAIFSGSMFGALHAVREAFGPLKLDATGYCGKWGQSVPSSGGSHYFLVLDPDPNVRLGGR